MTINNHRRIGDLDITLCALAIILFLPLGMDCQEPTHATINADASRITSSERRAQPKEGPPEGNRLDPQTERPRIVFPYLRQDEKWSFLSDRSKRNDYWDFIKYLSLGCKVCYLSIGGEARTVYEFYDNAYWGSGPQDNNGFWTQRYMLHTDWHLGNNLRFFLQLASFDENGRKGGPRPFDEDKVDFHQGFIDVSIKPTDEQLLIFRAGRQELFYGSGRLIEAKEGLNKRISWDGGLVRWQKKQWRIDGFAVRPVLETYTAFRDRPDHTTQFWGVYASGPLTRTQNLDIYYIGLDQKQADFDKGSGRQLRQTFGGRWWGTSTHWDYDDESIGQLGRFDQLTAKGPIKAWAESTDHGYTFSSLGRRPRIGVRADAASGDANRKSTGLGTFSPLYPKGKYFGEADLNGPSNTIDILPNVSVDGTKRLRATAYYGAFWRQSTHDGVYGFATNLQRQGDFSSKRFIGQQAEIDFDYTFSDHTLIRAVYQHFFPGASFKQTPPDHPVNYVTVWWTYHF